MMSMFLTKLCLEVADDADDGMWIVKEPLRYRSDVAERIIVVPAGFRTDLASVPRLPFIYLLMGNTSTAAAVIHDFLYSKHLVKRRVADAVLREASKAIGVPWWRRNLMWIGVRVFGGSHW
jgi:hypothetical protein